MGRKKKPKYVDMRASTSGLSDAFGTVFESMAKSDAYINLPLGAKHFYTLCRVQSKTKQCRQCLYNHAEENGREYNENYFVFPASHLEQYGIDKGQATRMFAQLEKAGFIKKIESNSHQKKVNVYEFDDKWKN